jgi:LPS-assembly protein
LNIKASCAILPPSPQHRQFSGFALKRFCAALLLILPFLIPRGAAARDVSLACTALPEEPVRHTTDGQVEITADSSRAEIENRRVLFFGEVELLQDERRLTADEVSYNQADEHISAHGNIVLSQPGILLAGDEADVDLRTDYARIQPLRYELPGIGGRGRADEGEARGENVFHARRIEFTTCAPGDQSWLLSAKELKVNREDGRAEARNARLIFKGVPLLASPWVQFPIDDRRLSGFLVPTGGYSSRDGLNLTLPYYLNLAPNYDATLFPRLITKRGLMLGTEFRYLLPGHNGTLIGEILPDDRLYEGDNDFRGALRIDHRSRFSERLQGRIRYSVVSDDDYLQDLGRDLGVTSTRYLDNLVEARYNGDSWQALASWNQQEVLGDFDQPISRFPQIAFATRQPLGRGTHLEFDAEYINFERDPGVSGQRVDLYPVLNLEWREPWGYLRPRIGGRLTRYALDESFAGGTENPDRSLYSASLDTGLVLERDTDWLDERGIQTLEPRLYYLYVPYRDQDDIPVFDSTIPDLSFANLFRENRFTGSDRVGDANQLSLGLTTRFFEAPTLQERFSASLGQIIYFEDRRVQLPGEPVETSGTSPLVAEIDLTLSKDWSAVVAAQWDPDEDRTEDSLVRILYQDRARQQLVSLAYRYDPVNDLEYSDVAFDWPLTSAYRLVGRWQYSLATDRTMEALGGLEYDSCCWRLRGALRRYIANTDGDYDTSIFLQLELKGLGRLGDDIDSLLRRSLYGYDPLDR